MPNLSPNLRVISEKKALCQGFQGSAGTTGQTELVLDVKSALQDAFSPAVQEPGARACCPLHVSKGHFLLLPNKPGVLSSLGTPAPLELQGLARWKVLPQGKQVLIVWPVRTMATDSGTNQACDGQPLLILFGKDALCSARVAKAVKWKPAATDGSPLRESLPLRKTITEENSARE